MKKIGDEVQYYYDTHPTEEDLMGETWIHRRLVRYLVLVLQWLFHEQACAISDNLNFYQTLDPNEYPVAPDIAVIKGVPEPEDGSSWTIGRTGPAPQVVFEIASKETWRKDVEEKPRRYANMGVEEYYVYDPNDPPLWRNTSQRLRGWQLDRTPGEMVEMAADPQGRLWSSHLDSWLVPHGKYLRLYDRNNQQRLTETEALAEKLRALGVNPNEI